MDISDDDIIEAMKAISGYLDITPEDFKEIYIAAYMIQCPTTYNSSSETRPTYL